MHSLCVLFALLLLFFPGGDLIAQSDGSPDTGSGTVIFPEPVPFSLDSISAIDCIALLRETHFLQVKNDEGESATLVVNTVWSYFLGYDERYPEGHRLRYDIIVNGSPLDWDRSFIEYGEEMLNLRLLFLYRNMHPGQELEYRSVP